jgi:excisionase family DNA binding protein
MKNHQSPQTYISTSQAAKMLGLSVGTVQRMVQNGVFKAFVTHGGHRRILTESLNDYFKGQGFAQPLPQQATSLVCILHDSEHPLPALDTLAQWDQVKVMTHPLDLMEISNNVGVFFIDARIPWVHASPLHVPNGRMQNAHIVLYNSACRPANSTLNQAKHLSLLEGDISSDLVYGYLLRSDHEQEPQVMHH